MRRGYNIPHGAYTSCVEAVTNHTAPETVHIEDGIPHITCTLCIEAVTSNIEDVTAPIEAVTSHI